MQRIASIQIYDALEQVVVHVHVREFDGLHVDGPTNVWDMSVQVRGEGIDEGDQWLTDALVALIEAV